MPINEEILVAGTGCLPPSLELSLHSLLDPQAICVSGSSLLASHLLVSGLHFSNPCPFLRVLFVRCWHFLSASFPLPFFLFWAQDTESDTSYSCSWHFLIKNPNLAFLYFLSSYLLVILVMSLAPKPTIQSKVWTLTITYPNRRVSVFILMIFSTQVIKSMLIILLFSFLYRFMYMYILLI